MEMRGLTPPWYNNGMDVREAILRRWSARRYDPNRLLTEEELYLLMDAARRAPSSYNTQPWRYIVGFNFDDTHRKILGILVPGNAEWAKDAPLLGLLIGSTVYPDGTPYRDYRNDCGMSLMALFLQAVDLGLTCRAMGGFYGERAREVFGIPEEYEPVVAFACGKPAEPPNPKEKKPLDEILFRGKFGEPYGLGGK